MKISTRENPQPAQITTLKVYKMVDSVRNDIITVTSQKQLSKRADEKAVTDYVIKSFTTNTDESVIN